MCRFESLSVDVNSKHATKIDAFQKFQITNYDGHLQQNKHTSLEKAMIMGMNVTATG